jgi:hypothetical protein
MSNPTEIAALIRLSVAYLTEHLDSLSDEHTGHRLHDAEHVLSAAEDIHANARKAVRAVRDELGLDD